MFHVKHSEIVSNLFRAIRTCWKRWKCLSSTKPPPYCVYFCGAGAGFFSFAVVCHHRGLRCKRNRAERPHAFRFHSQWHGIFGGVLFLCACSMFRFLLAAEGRCQADNRLWRGNGGRYAKARPRGWGDILSRYDSKRFDGPPECLLIRLVAYRDRREGRRFFARFACCSKPHTPNFAILSKLL